MSLRERAVRSLLWAYGCLLFATIGIIVLQGFHTLGFALSERFMMWLGGATVGEIGGLAALVYGSLFRRK